jgi:hypothetical protein
MDRINMTPTGRINLPVECPETSPTDCTGVVSLWAWYHAPHRQRSHDHSTHQHKPTADEGRVTYRHKRRRRRVSSKPFSVKQGARKRVAMKVGSFGRQLACHRGRLTVDVIVRRQVEGEWLLTSQKLVLRPRCPGR